MVWTERGVVAGTGYDSAGRALARMMALAMVVLLAGCSSSPPSSADSQARDPAPSDPASAATPTSGSPASSTSSTEPRYGEPGCGLPSAAFCETFDKPAGAGTRTGDLDPVLWGVSRLGNTNPDGQMFNDVAITATKGCGPQEAAFAPDDVRICNGQMFESVNDGGGVAQLNTYPKQPFDFTGRTGIVTFDVSADSEGSHAAWPEFVITDKPVPGIRRSISDQVPPAAANSIGFSIDGGCGMEGMTGVGNVFMTVDHVYEQAGFTTPNCITKGSAAKMNHFEVRISEDRLEVWGTDAGASELKQLAVADDLNLAFSKGLVWLDDVHYNARKAIEPCQCGTQFDHTFIWDNLGFDGPKTYRDLGYDVADADVEGSSTNAQDPTRRVGYKVGKGPLNLEVHGVRRDQTPSAAQVVLNTYSYGAVIPSISINGGPWIDTAWPFDPQTYSWRSLSIPVPLDQVVDGDNTISFKSADRSTLITNASLILVAASPVP